MTRGSTWGKWDLHVHTPESILHNYPGDKENAWTAFIDDLESLPSDFRVIGVNDYLFVDGYERLRNAKENGRLRNIDLLLPTIELRVDRFAGAEGALSRINVHVIFDDLPPEVIRTHFLAGLTRHLTIDPSYSDTVGKWNAIPTPDSLIDLGNMIIDSVPAEEKSKFRSPLQEGFNNLNVSMEKINEVLQSHYLKDRYLIALGKTEWSDIRWNNQTIADKKNLINSADCVFTAAVSPERYQTTRQSLIDQNVNNRLLDCSDAHWLSGANDKDRIGNCFTWIKADASFEGLNLALLEFDKRVFVGERPPKLSHVRRHPSRYINRVTIKPRDPATPDVGWFDCEIPLNPGLVAVIGNKGSGKSALLDTLGLLGQSKNFADFSFLNERKFLHPRTRLGSQFVATLEWESEENIQRGLNEVCTSDSDERVRYLPQQYVEKLCNELKEVSPNGFEAELRGIVFGHVDEADRLGYSNIDDLLDFHSKSHEEKLDSDRKKLAQTNRQIVELEGRLSKGRSQAIRSEKRRLDAELAAHDAGKPEAAPKPDQTDEASRAPSDQLQKASDELAKIKTDIEDRKSRRQTLKRHNAVSGRLLQRAQQIGTLVNDLKDEVRPELIELGMDDDFELIEFEVNAKPLQTIQDETKRTIATLDFELRDDSPESLTSRRLTVSQEVEGLKAKLAEPQRRFLAYQEAINAWERARQEIVGSKELPGSLEYIKSQIDELERLPDRLEELRRDRSSLVRDVHTTIGAISEIFRKLYAPITTFLGEFNEGKESIPVSFAVEITESGLLETLWTMINRQVRGSFSGVEESDRELQSLLSRTDFANVDEVVEFVDEIDRRLHFDTRDAVPAVEIDPHSQLRKGQTLTELYDCIYGLGYLNPAYSLRFGDKSLDQLSPGERGLLLLIFYLLVDRSNLPLIVDQPEENLDNQTIYETLVQALTEAVRRRQVIVATHSSNVAVVCDADQIIHASRDPRNNRIDYECGSLENPPTNATVVTILEGTKPAFVNRRNKLFSAR